MNVKLPDDLIFEEDVLADVHHLFGDEIEIDDLGLEQTQNERDAGYWRFWPGVAALIALSVMLFGWFCRLH